MNTFRGLLKYLSVQDDFSLTKFMTFYNFVAHFFSLLGFNAYEDGVKIFQLVSFMRVMVKSI